MAINGNQAGRLNAGTPATWQPLGTGAVALNEDIQGGVHSKASLTEINAIPGSRLANGMLAFANDTEKYYQYTGGTFSGVSGTTPGGSWAEFSTGGGGGSSSSESIVAWLKNSGSKVFNFVGGELSSFTITATDASVWTQALNFTAGSLTSITYTHDSGNESVWETTVITKTFNYTNGELSSIDYNRS